MLTSHFKKKKTIPYIKKYILKLSNDYNITIKNIIKDYCNYIIRFEIKYINTDILNFMEFIMHLQDFKNDYVLNYSILKFCSLFDK